MITGPREDFRALILMGVSGSGKSTVAALLAFALHWPFKDGDDFHSAHDIEKMRAGHPLTDDDRLPWLRAIAAEIERRRKNAQSIVMACSALKRTYRAMLTDGHDDVRFIYLKGDRDMIAGRLAKREYHFMPPKLLDSQFCILEEPEEDENPITVKIDASVDEIVERIICQLDRTREDNR